MGESMKGLVEYKQFINWELSEGGVKRPIDPVTGRPTNPHDPKNWMTYEEAAGKGLDVGFVLTEDDPFFFLDIDYGISERGEYLPLTRELLTVFHGAAVETSSSGRGLHVIGSATVPEHKCKFDVQKDGMKLELYHTSRFIALTRFDLQGDASLDFTDALKDIVVKYFQPSAVNGAPAVWSDEPRSDWGGLEDDRELIKRALRSKSCASIFGVRAAFEDLWNANAEVLGAVYPPHNPEKSAYDANRADAALAQHLAFWTGCNHQRIRDLMLQSGLAREKWNRESYLRDTIIKAVNQQDAVHSVLKPKTAPTPPVPPTAGGEVRPTLVTGSPFLTISDQIELFRGCVYVEEQHKTLVPGGILVDSSQFRAMYGGYVFVLGADNAKTTTNAWTAFSESQSFRKPRAHFTCFKPKQPAGAILLEEGRAMVNLWSPPVIHRVQGDVSPFLTHVKKLFPDDRDREIFISYLAACAQYVGEKFRWCVLVQGVQGNGKTLFSKCAGAAVGKRYTHYADALEMGEKFNAWLYGHVLICVNEVYVLDNFKLMEKLKGYIAEDEQGIREMRRTSCSTEICCNFILSTNHKEAIQKTADDRRYCVFYTPHQDISDLHRDGMGEGYFQRLFGWLKRGEGYAKVAEYLLTYKIRDEFNPIYVERAPTTTSTEEALRVSRDAVELEIEEAIEQGVAGFRKGWVSSWALDRLIEEKRLAQRSPRGRRAKQLNNLGYIRHPHLPDGRVTKVVYPDGCKPRLYVHPTCEGYSLTSPLEISERYAKDQK